MTSLEQYVTKIKPTLESFLREPNKKTIDALQTELRQFNWSNLKIFHVQLLIPLVLKLDMLSGPNQELQTGTINCISLVTSKLYINEIKGLKTTLIIVLKQIRVFNNATIIPNLSEELQLAAVECISIQIARSTTDVLEQFYTKDSSSLLGQILLTLVEFIEQGKYKKLTIASLQCLMAIFYVHDEADLMDVVLRSQVADTVFIFLPKVVTVLSKTSLADEKMGETLKSTAIKALGRILCVMYEETNEDYIRTHYSAEQFQDLVFNGLQDQRASLSNTDAEILGINKNKKQLEERMKQMQIDGRTKNWIGASSRKMQIIFERTKLLRSHQSTKIRQEYANMCCTLLSRCAHNLKDNFLILLENVVALSEDDESNIRQLCQKYLQCLQIESNKVGLFDENAEKLFEIHLINIPRIINRSQDDEQYAELLFLKGFLHNLSATKLQLIFALPKNVEMFAMCLIETANLVTSRELLYEEYALRQVQNSLINFNECAKLPWRKFKNLNSERCIRLLRDICGIIGTTKYVNQMFFEHLANLLKQVHAAMNEIVLIMQWLATENKTEAKINRSGIVDTLLLELFDDKHWNLALQADQIYRLKADKPSSWFVDRTPGLYESAIEIRTQDYDSDDEFDYNVDRYKNHVNLNDAQFNVLHTCIVLDALGHCATFVGERFDKYTFNCLHKVLLKLAHCNTIVHQAAYFALISIQKALKYAETSHLIDGHTDYITFHLNTILKRSPESNTAVDILTAVLQFSTRNALPHLDGVFQTIREECAKTYRTANVISYLKVFNAFLQHIAKWQQECEKQLAVEDMEKDEVANTDILANWLEIFEKPKLLNEENNCDTLKDELNTEISEDSPMDSNINEENTNETNPTLPRHIETIKEILNQVLKFVSSSEQSHQILSLECLITGVPLLKDYENELLPLVHSIWQPLIEKFRQKQAVVLNRCFTLLNILGIYAKEFILKRSLDNVIPFLKQFLKQAAEHSATEVSKAQTQEYKLQLILLREFGEFIKNLQIDGKHFNEIAEIIAIYLNRKQPRELQILAMNFYIELKEYNGPLLYVVVLKRAHLPEYKESIEKLLIEFSIS